jgi:hypothetical protein
MCPANHISSRTLLRSSSTREPSDPPHRVVNVLRVFIERTNELSKATNTNVQPNSKYAINIYMMNSYSASAGAIRAD